MKKRLLSGLLCLALLLSVLLPAAAVEPLAYQEQFFRPYAEATYELSYRESIRDRECLEIRGYRGTASGKLVIPERISGKIVKYIYYDAFQNCTGFRGELKLPNTLVKIDSGAFKGCTGFDGELKLPDTLIEIGSDAFSGCAGFTGSLKLPNALTEIGSDAFKGCTGFTGSLQLPEGLTSIGMNAFEGCTGFTGGLQLPQSLTDLESWAFKDCTGLNGALRLPETMTHLQDGVFWGCTGLPGPLKLPQTLVSIGTNAFRDCSSLIGSVTLPPSLETVGENAFAGCQNLAAFEAPGNPNFTCWEGMLLNADGTTLLACPGQKQGALQLPDTLTAIRPFAFRNCSGLTGTVVIPARLVTVGEQAFSGCTGLTDFQVAPGNPNYQSVDGILLSADGSTLVAFPAGRQGAAAFPSTVTAIGIGAFSGCTGLSGDLQIPGRITEIGEAAFLGCTGLDGRLLLENGLKTIGDDAFTYCDSLSGDLMLPDSLTLLGSRSFMDCSGLGPTLSVGSGLDFLPLFCFSGCTGLRTVYLPISVVEIRPGAFSDCTGLQDVHYAGPQDQWNWVHVDREWNEPLLNARMHCNSALSRAYSLFFDSAGGQGAMPETASYEAGTKVIIGPEVPTRADRNFLGWYDGDMGQSYLPGDSFTMPERSVTLTAMWDGPYLPYAGASYELTYEKNPLGGVTVTGFVGTAGGRLVLPEQINLEAVTAVAPGAFRGQTGFTGILSLGLNLRVVGDEAFFGCTGLNGPLNLFEVEQIGARAFSRCTSVECVVLPFDRQTTIGEEAFAHCTGMTSLPLIDNVTSIGAGAFRGCIGLNSHITLGEQLEMVGDYAFAGCPLIKSVFVDPYCPAYRTEGDMLLTKDGTRLLYCAPGTSGPCSIPQGVVSIDPAAFDDCTGLVGTLGLPASLKEMESDAFADCTGLVSVTVAPENQVYSSRNGLLLTKNGENLLFCPRGRTGKAAIPAQVRTLEPNAFRGCSELTEVVLPEQLVSVGSGAFRGCTALSGQLLLGSRCSAIGSDAFRDCGKLTGLRLPESVKVIGQGAFHGCTGLKTVEYLGSKTQQTALELESDNEPLEAAEWTYEFKEQEPEYELRYNLMGGSGFSVRPQTYAAGRQFTLSRTEPTKSGYLFRGWSYGGKTYNSGEWFRMPDKAVELKAQWEKKVSTSEFQLGWSNNSFIHNNAPNTGFYGTQDYWIPSNLYRKLIRGAASWSVSLIKKNMHDEWGGSCFGIASTMALVHAGQLNERDITDGTSYSYYAMPNPCEDRKLLNSINYYQLSQFCNYSTFFADGDWEQFFESLFSYLDNGYPGVFCFFTNSGGHAVLAISYEERYDGSYYLKLYDENTVGFSSHGAFSYLYVSPDKRQFEYTTSSGQRINPYTCNRLEFYAPEDLEPDKPYVSTLAVEDEMSLLLPVKADYTLTLADGTQIIMNPETGELTGNAYIRERSMEVNEENSRWMLRLPTTETLTVTSPSGSLDLTADSWQSHLSVEAQGAGKAVLVPGEMASLYPTGTCSFDVAISTDVLVGEGETNLISVAGTAAGPVTVNYDQPAQVVRVQAAGEITQPQAWSYVGVDRLALTDEDPRPEVLEVSSAYEPDARLVLEQASEHGAQLQVYNDQAAICAVAVYDENGRMVSMGMEEIPAQAGGVWISYPAVAGIEKCRVTAFLLDANHTPLQPPVS